MVEYITEPDVSGKRIIRCACGWQRLTDVPIEKYHHNCYGRRASGPGTELTRIIVLLGIKPDKTQGCGGECEKMARQMNAWGPEVCREHRAEIVAHLRKAYSKLTWAEVSRALLVASQSRLAWKIKSWDVCGSLVDLAIERAEANLLPSG